MFVFVCVCVSVCVCLCVLWWGLVAGGGAAACRGGEGGVRGVAGREEGA